MKAREALKNLAEVTESQWGMATTAQAGARGISPMNLSRLTEAGDLVRLAQGVYRDAGAPSDEHEALRAAWLAIEPTKLAYERLNEHPHAAVVSGESASRLHGIGDLRATRSEFTTPTRKQTQRPDVHYRTRSLPAQDVTVRDGLPTTTRERTLADLVEDRQDLSVVGDALRDAARQTDLDLERLSELLAPLAERNGHRKHDGDALLEELLQIAGLSMEDLARKVSAMPGLALLITAQYLSELPKIDTAALAGSLLPLTNHLNQLPKVDTAALAASLLPLAVAAKMSATPRLPDLSALDTATSATRSDAAAER
ncbi:type IV toxin-antitoxin system AbiEi family antitoxin domain-containing protein [Plantibacter flavus]|uniref:type IV toxin-antitoxin system AbiEi family antitoxin domain-containing protein n=1 Tax=Plantibacter flavus TaxID=150123 RepID=UPI003F174502